MQELPKIIQGGMGVAISNYRLANAVSRQGQLGVVSGTGIALILIGRLMEGDPTGEMRDALSHFPFQETAQRILNKYFVEGGSDPNKPITRPPMWTMKPSRDLEELTVVSNFVEVFLAKHGHNNYVGINLLEKVQMPTMASLYGAMLAGVDFVIMGAGIPLQIPGILDKLANHEAVSYRLDVVGATQEYSLHFDPKALFPNVTGTLKRPNFLPIISSVVLAQALLKRATGRIDGFVIETPIAGGHNAPPRGQVQYNALGEPIYTEKDTVDYAKIKAMGLPFWIGGGYGSHEKLQEAIELGAQGIQVGTAFAYCEESGMASDDKHVVVQRVLDDGVQVRTSAVVSPTGFPFKVVQLEHSLANPDVYNARERICDIGYLRHLYEVTPDRVGFRCPAEPVDQYVKKGGVAEDTEGRVCLCNCLGAAAGYAQRRKSGYEEPTLITSGDDLVNIGRFVPVDQATYTAEDVIGVLLGEKVFAN